MLKNPIEASLVIISNLFPLYGLFYLGWSPFNTVLIFLIETLLILLFYWIRNILRVFNGIYSSIIPTIVITVPVLIFSAVQLLISTVMFGVDGNSVMWAEAYSIIYIAYSSTIIGVSLMALRELVGFIFFLKNKRYKLAEVAHVKATYQSLGIRIFIMQFTVIIGGIIAKASGNAAIGVSFLVLINATINFYRHSRS